MVTLNNPVNAQNVLDRFVDFVTNTVNSSIVWGTDSKPFPEMPDDTFAGPIAGVSLTAASIGSVGDLIIAATIVNNLVTETALYTNIRNLRAILNVTGGGGNTGSRPTAGVVFDQTSKSNLNSTNYRQTLNTIDPSNVLLGQLINTTNLETFYTNCQTEYTTKRDNTVTIQVDVCHASCHSSCHSNRGRR